MADNREVINKALDLLIPHFRWEDTMQARAGWWIALKSYKEEQILRGVEYAIANHHSGNPNFRAAMPDPATFKGYMNQNGIAVKLDESKWITYKDDQGRDCAHHPDQPGSIPPTAEQMEAQQPKSVGGRKGAMEYIRNLTNKVKEQEKDELEIPS